MTSVFLSVSKCGFAAATAASLAVWVTTAVTLLKRLSSRRLCWKRCAPAPLPASFGVSAFAISSALRRIEGLVHRTPVMRCRSLEEEGREVFFKCEALQRTGSFKIRGALNAALLAASASASSSSKKTRPLVTHSSGNHAQALALAATLVGEKKAHIVMPRTAPDVKRAAVVAYGGIVTLCDPTNEARSTAAAKLVSEVDGHFVHPSDDVDVIAGQGTVAAEFLEQLGAENTPPDVLVVPVGGGGLISGIAVYAKSKYPSLKVVGAEPALVDDAKRSKDAGVLFSNFRGNADTVADGLKTFLGDNTWPVVRDLVDDIFTVTEEQIIHATKLVWTRAKLCVEPSAGVGVAALLSDDFKRRYPSSTFPRVGVILCGGNLDLNKAAKTLFHQPTNQPTTTREN